MFNLNNKMKGQEKEIPANNRFHNCASEKEMEGLYLIEYI